VILFWRRTDIVGLERLELTVSAAGCTRFYIGFGISISVFLLAQGVVLWQLATLAKHDLARVRPILVVFLIAVIANAVLSWKVFFPVPLGFEVAIAACLGLALVAGGSSPASEQRRE
jgi:hypothetical protein